jgi:putative endonuclease
MPAPDRRAVGSTGEDIACQYLLDQGFNIADRNWRSRSGELDIVARKGDVTVFVEVKARRGRTFGEPEEAVTPAKARRIRGLAAEYLASGAHSPEVRFDVISVMLDQDGTLLELRHIPDAF